MTISCKRYYWKQPSPNQQRREVETKSIKHNGQQRYGTYLTKWRETRTETKQQQWKQQQQLPAQQRRWQQPSWVRSFSDPTPMQCFGATKMHTSITQILRSDRSSKTWYFLMLLFKFFICVKILLFSSKSQQMFWPSFTNKI